MTGGEVSRRSFLGSAAGLGGLMLVVSPARFAAALAESDGSLRAAARFLTAHELATLRAVTDRLLPGPPEDPDPGAVEARCAEAIDLLLSAFDSHPPLIFAGGPYSDRAGNATDDMAHFLALDPVQELGWRIRLEGSRGMPEREFAGPVVGLQQQYRDGLARLDRLSAQRPGASLFTKLSATEQDAVMNDPSVADFVAQALSDTIAAMYGPPEYGGNYGLVGWQGAHWDGDVRPRGFADHQITDPDPGRRRLAYDTVQARHLVTQLLPGSRIVG